MMDRRNFMLGTAGAVSAPSIVLAQLPNVRGKIGYVHPVTVSPSHITFLVLRKEWQRLGYVEGDTVLVRSADNDPKRLPGLVSQLVGQGVGVLIVVGADAVRAAAKASQTTPIVAIDLETDPVRSGLAANLARPGGNVTGLFLDLPVLATKWIELLREAAPDLERIAFAWQPSTGRDQLDIGVAAAKRIGLDTVILELQPSDDFDAKFALLDGRRRTGVVQLTFPGLGTVAPRYAAAAVRHRLPAIAFLRVVARAGILLSYGPSQENYFARAVGLADKILRGENAGDIPIERPTKFELVVNLKTAKALGLTIPAPLLFQATKVIQ